MNRLSILLWCVITIGLCLVIPYLTFPDKVKSILGNNDDVFKLTLQFLLITIGGGVIAYLFKLLEYERDKRLVLRAMHTELLNAYNEAKKARRELRAAVKKEDATIAEVDYEKQIEILSDSQLVFEVHARRASDRLFWTIHNKELNQSLDEIESYLNAIVTERQEQSSNDHHKMADLEHLSEFIAKFKNHSKFDLKFKKRIRDVLKALGRSMLS